MSCWMYDVRIVGEVSDEVLAKVRSEFGLVHAAAEPASTVIRSTLPDQAGLVGMLMRLQDLGLEVYEVRRDLEPDTDACRDGTSGA